MLKKIGKTKVNTCGLKAGIIGRIEYKFYTMETGLVLFYPQHGNPYRVCLELKDLEIIK